MYHLWLKQSGQGCDYTIECGEKIFALHATNLKDAAREALQVMNEYSSEHYSIQEATLFKMECDLTNEMMALQTKYEESKKQDALTAKRKQLEQLKKELGES